MATMGRQISVALSEEDEQAFLAFLRADADIRIYRWAAASPEDLRIDQFLPPGAGEWVYTIWNTAFAWNPQYAQWQSDTVRDPELVSQFYLRNTAGAPLLEYLRHALHSPKPQIRGRVYWNTDFALAHGPVYDTTAFRRWYDHVARWLRKNGQRVEAAKNWYQYWHPGAWAARHTEL